MSNNNQVNSKVIETEVPLGTVHSAALEPYRVRLFVEDEYVRDAEITIGVNHRGIERIMEGLPVEKANALTEKICGICSHIHIWNSCLVAEKGLEIDVPPRAEYIRLIMGELERLHSHLLYLAHGCEVLGHETFSMRIFYIRETVMELLRMIGGNRVQYGVPVIGGIRPRSDLNEMRIQKIKEGMDLIEEKVTEFADRFTRDPMIMSRVTGVAALSKEDALRLAATGPTLRSTGVEVDLRRDMRQYDPFEFEVITQEDGDVKSNLLMRALEIFEAIKIIRQAVKDLPEGKITNRSWEMHDTGIIRSYIEAPRGKLYHSYRLEDGRVRNSIIRTPSITNINAMEHACVGTHITDAQLAIVQCDPCFTCTDRAIQIVDHPLKKSTIK
ncbi:MULTISPECIES: nickel-dependent hydrogenase large subunit [Methanobacterium]|jgi:energy-converting hydrogenase B subunit N|uniref:Nickel-dependent hydrogenase large subunit n=1 Tax=Methanobacterium veterum TaxID=408577 RepID=A0A9E5DLA5_9EURY|nr:MULTISPECIES: nickel-dependent hydrogenase large subunit [Methanobacterium]MCZ3366087.1 nickel-dependent hydrogenase large subunit [Methanobacterium veterum]MCZ3371685.1 nickel-dependent hydrogenase large subunit [Methanobacterium veterum]